MAVSIIFSGAPEENPEDFMRAFLRDMGTADLAQKLDFFENYLKSGSDADNWFTKLDDITKNTWPAVRAAFKARFPAIPTVQKSFAEYEAELSDISLKEEDLGRKVVVGGNEVWSHQAHADAVLRIATAMNIQSTSQYVATVRRHLPPLIKAKLDDSYPTWAEFTSALRNMSVTYIMEGAEAVRIRAAEQKAVEDRQRELDRRISQLSSPLPPFVPNFPKRTSLIPPYLLPCALHPGQMPTPVLSSLMRALWRQPSAMPFVLA